ncbi:alpha/beta hydrolase [Labedella endophytica]|uniref:Alpha/beta hydrolase n=1 Tax=Labedella endophytica TaxID=1523160 RepID=A0A3S0VD34_9MICO|nr:alpha/beta hydrolase [Labedella endophytica]RUQ96905.1 alpha/beta hydrolase [Labedella endophytica]
MDIESVDPQLRPALAKLPSLDNSKRLVRLLGRYGPRLLRVEPVEGVTVRSVREGTNRLRLYEPVRPSAPGPALLWIHGGGLVIGAAQQDDRLCLSTAQTLGIPVVSAAYRLAPEHPFPAALDDVAAAWTWLQGNAAALGVDPSGVAIGGESAGAGIATSLAHRLLDEGGTQPVAQWLFAPMLDDRTAARTELDAIDHPVWNNSANRFGWSSYLGTEAGAEDAPRYAVPARRDDLSGLPPVWIYSGDIELFHDEIVAYTARLRSAGVDVTAEVVPGAAHGFENWAHSTDLAQGLIRRAQEWLERTLLGSRP